MNILYCTYYQLCLYLEDYEKFMFKLILKDFENCSKIYLFSLWRYRSWDRVRALLSFIWHPMYKFSSDTLKALKVGKILNIWKIWITEFRLTAHRILKKEIWELAVVFLLVGSNHIFKALWNKDSWAWFVMAADERG